MNKTLFITAALLIPGTLLAEVKINVNIRQNAELIQSQNQCNQNSVEITYRDKEEAWFEEVSSSSTINICREYKWTQLGKKRALRYRLVCLNTRNGLWTFGQWQKCELAHKKPLRISSCWNMNYQKRGKEVICVYEYKPHFSFSKKESGVYRYEGNKKGYSNDFLTNNDSYSTQKSKSILINRTHRDDTKGIVQISSRVQVK